MLDMRKLQNLKTNQSGDTIVEVLIAMVVLSTVVIGAYQISNMSLKQIRMAQERTEAQEIARQATERLDMVYSKNKTTFASATPVPDFCIDLKSVGDSGYTIKRTTDTPSFTCLFGESDRYLLTITNVPPYGFETTVTWDSVGGGQERLQINYRVGAE